MGGWGNKTITRKKKKHFPWNNLCAASLIAFTQCSLPTQGSRVVCCTEMCICPKTCTPRWRKKNINVRHKETQTTVYTYIIHSGTSRKCFCSSGCTTSQPSHLSLYFLNPRLSATKTYIKGNQHTLPSISHTEPQKKIYTYTHKKKSLNPLWCVQSPNNTEF